MTSLILSHREHCAGSQRRCLYSVQGRFQAVVHSQFIFRVAQSPSVRTIRGSVEVLCCANSVEVSMGESYLCAGPQTLVISFPLYWVPDSCHLVGSSILRAVPTLSMHGVISVRLRRAYTTSHNGLIVTFDRSTCFRASCATRPLCVDLGAPFNSQVNSFCMTPNIPPGLEAFVVFHGR